MKAYSAEPVSGQPCSLSESPCWDDAAQLVRWVDIIEARVFAARLSPSGLDVVDVLEVPGGHPVGCVVPAADSGLLLAVGGRLETWLDGRRVASLDLVPPHDRARLNDGRCDPKGRFLVGSMALGGRRGTDRLYRLEPDGDVTVLLEGLSLSNGLAWSPDGRTLFHVDSLDGVVRAFDYPADGPLGPPRVVVDAGPGLPDGLCVDIEGDIWLARWGAGVVHRHAPSGELTAQVDVHVPQPAGVAFVGPARDLLLITSGREHLSPAELARFPLLGQVFGCDVGVAGLPVSPWAGSAAIPPWSGRGPR